jgi:hypothetical protein
MRKVLLGILIGGLAVAGWRQFHDPAASGRRDAGAEIKVIEPAGKPDRFRCDGRIYCSQMTSCEEAEFFLENCPGVKMDGGGDGVPCERQWCGNR